MKKISVLTIRSTSMGSTFVPSLLAKTISMMIRGFVKVDRFIIFVIF